MDPQEKLPSGYTNFLKNKKITNMLIGDRFLILERLGSGEFGQIYKGIDLKNNIYVAVKILYIWRVKKQFNAHKKKLLLRYIDEEDKVLRKFQHKNILKWIATYKNQDFKLIVTQYCNEGNLYEMIQRYGSLDIEDAINVLKQLCQGIAALHQQGVCHRDIKPENIFIHNGNFILGDFGLSKAIGEEGHLKTNVGTFYTRAPEVDTGKYKLNADIYSLGVVLYIMITPKFDIPVRGIQAKNLDLNNLEIYLKSEQKAPPEVTLFLKKCLQKDPRNRLTWQNLIEDPIFSLKFQNKISNIYYVKIDMKQLEEKEGKLRENSNLISIIQSYSEQYIVKLEDQPLLSKNQSEINESFYQQLVFEENMQNSSQLNVNQFIKVLNTTQIHKITSNLCEYQSQQTKIYKRLKFFHLNVKKAEFIYKQIIYVIQIKKMWDLKKKKYVELMYMLSVRCFIYMSYIHDQSYQLPFEKFNEQLRDFVKNQIGGIYKKCQDCFQKYSNLLKSHEDKFVEMVSLRFKKITSNKQISAKQNIFNGIQKIDYEKKDQIEWIQKQLNKIQKFQIKDDQICKRMLAKFKAFTKINEITQKDVSKRLFDNYVEQLIYDNY